MGVIDLDARVKKLEEDGGGGAVIDQLEAAVTALEETVNGNGETDFGLVGDVAALEAAAVPVRENLTLAEGLTARAADGGAFYEVFGSVVHVHMAVDDFTADTVTTMATLPSAVRPDYTVYVKGNSAGYTDTTKTANGKINSDGTIVVYCAGGTSINADVTYILPAPAEET